MWTQSPLLKNWMHLSPSIVIQCWAASREVKQAIIHVQALINNIALEYLLFVITRSQSSCLHNACWFRWVSQGWWNLGHYNGSQSFWNFRFKGVIAVSQSFQWLRISLVNHRHEGHLSRQEHSRRKGLILFLLTEFKTALTSLRGIANGKRLIFKRL